MFEFTRDHRLILDNLQDVIAIDRDYRILYISDSFAAKHGMQSDSLSMRDVRTVFKDSHLPRIIETGQPHIGKIYDICGQISVRNGYPIHKDGVLIGAVEHDVFNSEDVLRTFLKSVYTGPAHTDRRYPVDRRKQPIHNRRLAAKYSIDDIVGESRAIRNLKDSIRSLAHSSSSVLITGETGTGKELAAHAIHAESIRRSQPFVPVNCAAIPKDLMESELFGYEEGSFTGASRGGRTGKVEQAHNGTLFLDEIDQLTTDEQIKLLRFIQEREITKIGGEYSTPVDFRLISATNRDLTALVQTGEFRADLYYRINVIELRIPPLRERKEDIPLLAVSLMQDILRETGGRFNAARSIDDEAIALLQKHDWPGNVRELRNVMERAIHHCKGKILTPDVFHYLDREQDFAQKTGIRYDTSTLVDIRDAAEKIAIEQLMQTCSNKTKVAKSLGITRETLYQKLKKYNIDSSDE